MFMRPALCPGAGIQSSPSAIVSRNTKNLRRKKMPSFNVLDLNTGTNAITDGTPGAVAPPPVNSAGQPLTNQLVSTTPDSVSVTALVPNVYIATGAGNDF